MKTSEEQRVELLLATLVDEVAFGLGPNDQVLIKAIPGSLTDRHRSDMMTVAELTQLSFLRLDESACQAMPKHVREKIMREADEFIAMQRANVQNDNVAEITDYRRTSMKQPKS